MADLTGRYLRGLKGLAEGDLEALDAGELVLKEIRRVDEQAQQPFDTSADYGYAIMMADKLGMSPRQQTFAACAFAGRYFIDDREEMKVMKKLMKKLPGSLSKGILYYRKLYDYTRNSVNQGTQAAYNSKTGETVVRALDRKHWDPVKEEYGAIPDLMLPLYGLMKEKSTGNLGPDLIHEASHAFIYQNTGYSKENNGLREIEEGAATAVTEVLGVEHSFNEEGRSETGLNPQKVLEYIDFFEKGVKDLPVPEAVDRIRLGAVKAIQLVSEGADPEKAVREAAERL